MGGQACVLYGAAEFSRDTDLAVLADAENLARLDRALTELRAECIAVPPFERRYLEMGLAVHFRCHHPEADGMRIDVLSKMRGVDDFPVLWSRRTTIEFRDETIDVMALPDLVRAKKTQRDKDWPMLARLVEANYFANRDQPTPEQIDFWLRELRTPSSLIEVARQCPARCGELIVQRPLLSLAQRNDPALVDALREEEAREREADRAYWQPLRRELERLRRERKRT
jgi:hypothetical protein